MSVGVDKIEFHCSSAAMKWRIVPNLKCEEVGIRPVERRNEGRSTMRAFAQHAKATRRTEPARFALQQSIEATTLARRRTADIGRNSAAPGSARLLHDFSGIPLHATILARTQPKLNRSTPQDPSEQAANRASEQVMSMSEPSVQFACACGDGCPKCRGQQLHRDSDRESSNVKSSDLGPMVVPPLAYEVTRSSGRALDPAVRGFMEKRFGHNFGRVRIHADAVAAAAAQAVDAKAYTLGEHVVFGAGQYAPASDHGRRLLAHELAHVVQQNSGAAPLVARQPKQSPRDFAQQDLCSKRLTENELSDFSRLWHDGCVEAITEAQDVDRNLSSEVSARGTALRKRSERCRMGSDRAVYAGG